MDGNEVDVSHVTSHRVMPRSGGQGHSSGGGRESKRFRKLHKALHQWMDRTVLKPISLGRELRYASPPLTATSREHSASPSRAASRRRKRNHAKSSTTSGIS